MKLNKKTFIFAISSLLLIIFGIFIFLFYNSSSKVIKIAFYKIPNEQQLIIKNLLINSVKENKKNEFKFLELNNNLDIIPQAKKTDILFTNMGYSANKAVDSISKSKIDDTFFDSKIIAGTSISNAEFSLSTYCSTKNKISQVPLFFDGMEMLISIQSLSETKTEAISSWSDIEKLAKNTKSVASGIAFAGGDADTLLAVISVLIEAFDGKEKYNSLIEKIKTYDGSMESLLETLLIQDETFHDAMQRLTNWTQKGIFNAELLDKTNEELIYIIEHYKTAIIFMPLSEHRKLSNNTAKFLTTLPIHSNETAFYFPSIMALNTRAAMTPSVAMISMSKNKNAKEAVTFLVGSDAQEKLAFKTGLAPFIANCKIPDIQSDDLRFWIAATSSPCIPMGLAAFDDDIKKQNFAKAIRDWIKNK